jgi:hypothetical protein
VVEQGVLREFKFYSQTIPKKTPRATDIMVPLGNCFLYRKRRRGYKKKGKRERQSEKEKDREE